MNGLWQILFRNNANPPFVTNDVVKVFYDASNNTFSLTKNGSALGSGPTLGDPTYTRYWRDSPPEVITNYSVNPINDDGDVDLDRPDVQFCDGTTLVTFDFSRPFPYATRVNNYNHSSCSVSTVCDLAFSSTPEVERPSDSGAADGSITVTATSSNGPIRYALVNVSYLEMTNTTGVFPDLVAGNYTVYARDVKGCLASIAVQLNHQNNHFVRWRLEYTDDNGANTKVDILQLDYTGDIVEVCGTDAPFIVRLRGENKNLFDPILATECSVNLLSETSYQFIDLFTQNDREFVVKYYKDDELKWSGYVTPGLYSEEYWSNANYYISANATDQLTVLNELDFADNNDNPYSGSLKLIKVIALILEKTDLYLPIHVACGIYENDFDTEVNPLDQSYIDVATAFVRDEKPMKCIEVLSEILKPFGARVYQWDNAWKIECIYQKSDTFNYDVFDSDGNYVSSSSFNPVVNFKTGAESDRAAWINRTPSLEIVPAAGTISVIHQLSKNVWGFKNGGFEEFVPPSFLPGYIQSYTGWSLFQNSNTASFARITQNSSETLLDGNDSEYRMKFISQANNTSYGEDAYILSENVPIIYTASDAIKFSFDFMAIESVHVGSKQAEYLKFKYSLTLDGYYLQDDGTWSTDTDLQWIEVLVPSSKFGTWETIQIHTLCPDIEGQSISTYNLRIMHGSAFGTCWIYTSTANLKLKETVKLPAGYIVNYVENTDSNTTTYRWYELIVSDTAEDLPELVRPDDYDGSTNRVIWEMIEEMVVRRGNRSQAPDVSPKPVQVNSFDNANLEFLPLGETAPDEKIHKSINNKNFKNNIEVPVTIGDAPVDITNSRYIYNVYLKRSNGEPTYGWIRDGFAEFQPLLSLLAKQYLEQYRKPRFKITGTFICDYFIGFNACLKDGNRYYIPMGMEINDKRAQYTVEIHETERANSDTVNPFGPAEFNTEEFGADYDI